MNRARFIDRIRYNHLPLEKRQVCWAHLLRDFERIAQRGALPGRIGQRLLGYGCLLFRWREQDKDARHFVWLQRRMLVQLEQGSVQTQCSRTAKTCANLLKMWRKRVLSTLLTERFDQMSRT